jgi:hypothetical protein
MTLAAAPVCLSYRAGHQMHWIQWKLARRAVGVPGRLVRLEGADLVLAADDGRTLRWWNHDPERVTTYAERTAGRLHIYPDLHALCIDNGWFNCDVSTSHSVCHARADER